MLSDLCEELYNSASDDTSDAAGDVLGDLAAEAAAFRKGTGDAAAWFRPVRIKNNCMGVIAVNPAHPQAAQVDVLHLVDLAFRRMVAAGQGNTRKVLRMWPLPTPVFPLALPVLRLASQALQDLIVRSMGDGSFPTARPVRVAISFKARSVATPAPDKLQLLTAMPPSDSPAHTEAADTPPVPVTADAKAVAVPALELEPATPRGAPAVTASAAGAAAEQDSAAAAVDETTLMTRDVVTPLMCAEVKRVMGQHDLPFVLVYKEEHITLELQALQSIAGAYAVITAEHDKAARFNMQKLPSASAKADGSSAHKSSAEPAAAPAAASAAGVQETEKNE